jgi:hypothetical protein
MSSDQVLKFDDASKFIAHYISNFFILFLWIHWSISNFFNSNLWNWIYLCLFTSVDNSIFVKRNAHGNITFGVNKVGMLHFWEFVMAFSFSFFSEVSQSYINICVFLYSFAILDNQTTCIVWRCSVLFFYHYFHKLYTV